MQKLQRLRERAHQIVENHLAQVRRRKKSGSNKICFTQKISISNEEGSNRPIWLPEIHCINNRKPQLFSRERLVSQREGATQSSDEESSEQQPKKSEINVKRMSVQDAISLFESKQRAQTVDNQKTKSSLSATVGQNKSVLRRWSAGTGEKISHNPLSVASKSTVSLPSNNLESDDIKNGSLEGKPEYDPSTEGDRVLPTVVEIIVVNSGR